MINSKTIDRLLNQNAEVSVDLLPGFGEIGFNNPEVAIQSLRRTVQTESQRKQFATVLPSLLVALAETSDCDRSVRNFERYVASVADRDALFHMLAENPRAVEILVKLFVGSQFLTEILLRNPDELKRLTQYKRLSEFKSREEFILDAKHAVDRPATTSELKLRLRKFHQWELLRIAACDTFGLVELRTATLQLSLLADAIVQVAIEELARLEQADVQDFSVIAFGKLGGLELNYSSDLDLVFVCRDRADHYFGIAQKLIRVLSDFTEMGFLYRVDMRLRPWGNSGPLVTTTAGYVDYLAKQSAFWERQALLKARTIAGNYAVGDELLERLRHVPFDVDHDTVRAAIWKMKSEIEAKNQNRTSVKNGAGGLRDIEFLVQCLQLMHGDQKPRIRKVGTQESLIALSDENLLHAEEYRVLSTSYLAFRTLEHSLQLMHNQPEYVLPTSEKELAYLARRLDFPDVESFHAKHSEHIRSVRRIFERHLRPATAASEDPADRTSKISVSDSPTVSTPSHTTADISNTLPHPARTHNEPQFQRLLNGLNSECVVGLEVISWDGVCGEMLIAGFDQLGVLPTICGVLFGLGLDVVSGSANTLPPEGPDSSTRKFVDQFLVRNVGTRKFASALDLSKALEAELLPLMRNVLLGQQRMVSKRLIPQLAHQLSAQHNNAAPILPVQITFEDDTETEATILHIAGEDVPGFLFELTNAISLKEFSIEKMVVQSHGQQVMDTLYVINPRTRSRLDENQKQRLRATIVLIKQFVRLLPMAPNPADTLTRFRGLLENLFHQPDWLDQFQTLHQPEVLAAIAKLLGQSDFLWEDFLRLQHNNLFPVVTDIQGLQHSRTREDLTEELSTLLATTDAESPVQVLNDFKDRAMMRVDMRHILGLESAFGLFSRELTAVAETIVEAALQMAIDSVSDRCGQPMTSDGQPSRLVVCALGKCGGQELGYASDIELLFLFDEDGKTDGRRALSNVDYFSQVVEQFNRSIIARQKRIFAIDLRLRPYGNAGSLAVSLAAFANYFRDNGPAWPYERQAMVKLRPIAGDLSLGQEVVELRDRLIYLGDPFDLSAMRALREKQIRKHVTPGTFHAKLSPGGLVDCEYFVQGLQLTFGHLAADIRQPNTRAAIRALADHEIITYEQRVELRDAYRFLRRLIDGMRMVRGDATDLTIPVHNTEEFEFLARRLDLSSQDLHREIERRTCAVIDFVVGCEQLIGPTGM